MTRIQYKESAISPVIAIMLMLVVTIIIAAVVSGFAGGLAGTQEKTPQAAISASFSQSKGMTITHIGGDTLPIGEINVLVRPSKTFGSSERWSWIVNKTYIYNSTGSDGKNWNSLSVFTPGSTVYIGAANLSFVQTQGDGLTSNYMDSDKGFANPVNIEKTIFVSLVDRRTGRDICKTETAIKI